MTNGTEGAAIEVERTATKEAGTEAGRSVAGTDMMNATIVTTATVISQTAAEITRGVKEEMRPLGSDPGKTATNVIEAATVARSPLKKMKATSGSGWLG